MKPKQQVTKTKRIFGLSVKAWGWNLGVGALALLIWYFVSPDSMSSVLYRGLITHLPKVGVVVISALICWRAYLKYDDDQQTRGVILGMFALSIGVVGWFVAEKWTNNVTYNMFADKPAILASYLPVDKDKLRYNPRSIVYNKIKNAIGTRIEEVTLENTFPYISEKGFGYVSPILLDGLRPSLMERNPGFLVYHDWTSSTDVIERVDQPFTLGVEMQYLDNIHRQLFFKDFFCVYDDIHYFPLDTANPKKFTAIAPKIKYKYSFPFFFARYWAGVTLIEADGTITELSTEEAAKDPRLKGRWIFPMSLAREYVDIQDYAVGFLNSFTSVNGKLSIPKIEHNQYPLVMDGEDGQTYFVVDTEPQGTGRGMFRMYYINATTGEMSYFQPPATKPTLGPKGTLSKVYSLKGYNWYVNHGESKISGNTIAIEPVYLTKVIDGEVHLYYKFSITSVEMTEISATVIVEAREGGELLEFAHRKDFEAWKNGSTTNELSLEQPSIDPRSRDEKLLRLRELVIQWGQSLQQANILIQQLEQESIKNDTTTIQ